LAALRFGFIAGMFGSAVGSAGFTVEWFVITANRSGAADPHLKCSQRLYLSPSRTAAIAAGSAAAIECP
jgi:hypothetical protein